MTVTLTTSMSQLDFLPRRQVDNNNDDNDNSDENSDNDNNSDEGWDY
jgi:hypothetical protein